MSEHQYENLGKIKKLNVRKIWKIESTDFTPWLASDENINLLCDAIGIELEVEQIEASVGPYSADILAKDVGTDKYVVIENQLGKTNHDHLGKAITYGSVLDASAVIWIASEFTEEHLKALAWLNEYTSEDLSFYGVKLEVWQIDKSLPAVRFNVLSRPAIIKRDHAVGKGELTENRKLQLEFWTEFRDKLIKSKVVRTAQTPKARYWFNVTIGKSGIFLSNIASTKDNLIGVRVYISNKIAEWALPQLESQKDQIENEIGEQLKWNPNPDSRDKIILITRELNLSAKDEWGEAIDWLVDMVRRFRKVFIPRVKKLTPP